VGEDGSAVVAAAGCDGRGPVPIAVSQAITRSRTAVRRCWAAALREPASLGIEGPGLSPLLLPAAGITIALWGAATFFTGRGTICLPAAALGISAPVLRRAGILPQGSATPTQAGETSGRTGLMGIRIPHCAYKSDGTDRRESANPFTSAFDILAHPQPGDVRARPWVERRQLLLDMSGRGVPRAVDFPIRSGCAGLRRGISVSGVRPVGCYLVRRGGD
jgi:hypothetical protein